MFVEVAFPIPLHQTFHYLAPHGAGAAVAVGQRVIAPFGRSRSVGYVVHLTERSPVKAMKPLVKILDPVPLIGPDGVALARWLADRYGCTWGEALACVLPRNLRGKPERLGPAGGGPGGARGGGSRGWIAGASVAELSFRGGFPSNPQGEADVGTSPFNSRRFPRRPFPEPCKDGLLGTTPGGVGWPRRPEEVVLGSSCSREDRRGDLKLLAMTKQAVQAPPSTAIPVGEPIPGLPPTPRDNPSGPPPLAQSPTLNPQQEAIRREIIETLERREPAVFLLHGVTDSGKTEVYFRVFEEVFRQGRQAIFLVPEIALTPQFIEWTHARFGMGAVGVWHSQLSRGERFRTWVQAASGAIQLMVGARSAVFAPFQALGAIVVDEEHEPTYKQEEKPRYHAREAAIERARRAGAVTVLGSATPSVESYWKAQTGIYRLLELPSRVDELAFPAVHLVDRRTEGPASRQPVFSPPLLGALEDRLAHGGQVILFINRRGFAPFVVCRGCGWSARCPSCGVTLVWHLDMKAPAGEAGVLRCHWCSYRQELPEACPQCRNPTLRLRGIGTQRVERSLRAQFPTATIARLDRDAAKSRKVYRQVYEDVKSGRCQVLIGTQMVSKGLDFPDVTLVGVVDADTALYLPDFRAAERTFQLVTQVAGRAGRSPCGGEVIVQTASPTHYALVAAAQHDYRTFYDQEIELRRTLGYPPFRRLVNVLVRGSRESTVTEETERLAQGLTRALEQSGCGPATWIILGPVPAARARIRKEHRWQVVLKASDDAVTQALHYLRTVRPSSGVKIAIDVDPQDLL